MRLPQYFIPIKAGDSGMILMEIRELSREKVEVFGRANSQ